LRYFFIAVQSLIVLLFCVLFISVQNVAILNHMKESVPIAVDRTAIVSDRVQFDVRDRI